MRLSNEILKSPLVVLFIMISLFASCAKRPAPLMADRERGLASWYGSRFHGRRTASGERYNQWKMTAAHKTLPFGTWVKVINIVNKKQVFVKINDRGPFRRGRIIDVSKAAARDLGMIGSGVAEVIVFYLPEGYEEGLKEEARRDGGVKESSKEKPIVLPESSLKEET